MNFNAADFQLYLNPELTDNSLSPGANELMQIGLRNQINESYSGSYCIDLHDNDLEPIFALNWWLS